MIQIDVYAKPLLKQQVDCYAFFLQEGLDKKKISSDVNELVKNYIPHLFDIFKKQGFTGKKNQVCEVPVIIDDSVITCLFLGLGPALPKNEEKIEHYRRAIGKMVKLVTQYKGNSVALSSPPATSFGVTTEYLAEQTAIIANMANYHFNEYFSKKEDENELFELVICTDSKNKKAIQTGVKKGQCVAKSVNIARHWIDLPPSVLTPPHLTDKAKVIAKDTGLKITVFDEKQINSMGMGGLAGVSRGSDLDCRLLILEYKAKKKSAPTIAFVGKGITFDSGGLSLKPPTNMETMKEDMSGAAAVIATMKALAELKPNVNVIGVTPLAENLPSGKATKPGDIVRFYNGKTAEVKNTDAEGRLILADALSYAVKHYKPDAIIDIATLTGACHYFLGPFYTGMLSQHDTVAQKVQKAGEVTGDRVWRLPMGDDYKVAIKSTVADISNTGSPQIKAGTTTAAHFLQNFVGDTPWVHLDIAGTAFNVPNISYFRPGATGAGVRLLIELAMSWK